MRLFNVIAIAICLLMYGNMNAQKQQAANVAAGAETKRLMDLLHKLEGTYQVQIVNSREKTEFPMVLLDTIVARRNQTQVVYYQMKPNVRIKILPQNMIESPGFIPLERIKYVMAPDK
jgi:hypothetical protein